MTDLRLAVRQLLHRPGFAMVALVTLTLGIGATTTIFSVVDHLMFNRLPFPEPDRIVTLWQRNERNVSVREDVAPANFLDWRARQHSFSALGAADPYSWDLTGQGPPQVMLGALVTEEFFAALDARPLHGRLLQASDFRDRTNVAVLGWGIWQRQFGGDPAVVGRIVEMDGEPVTIVGVLQRDFDLGLGYSGARKREVFRPRQPQGWESTSRSSAWWNVVARLAPGITLEAARSDMDRVARSLAEEYPATNRGVGIEVLPLSEHLVSGSLTTLWLLLGAVGLVLLIACVNVANLQLARGAERARELAVRAAIGAQRRRLVRQLLAESLVLATLGTVAGVALAVWGVDFLKAVAPGEIPRMETVAVNGRVLAFSALLAISTAVLFGLAPAVQLSRPNLRGTLTETKGSAGRRGVRLRESLIVGEAALALVLLVGAGLLVRSFMTLVDVDPGFARNRLLAVQVFHYSPRTTPAMTVEFFERTVSAMGGLPGVEAVGAVSAAPFLAANLDIRRTFRRVDQPPPRVGEERATYLSVATPGYFETMGIPILEGRGIEAADRSDAPRVVVVNRTFRRAFFGDESPLGVRLLVGTSRTAAEIVGVVGDVRHRGLDTDPRPEIFSPHAQDGTGSMTYFLRTAGPPRDLLAAAQRVIWDASPDQAIYQSGTLEDLIGATLAGRRFTLALLSGFAILALAMAAVGIYGVISFTTSQRTQEVGIRMALGADRRTVILMILRRGIELTAVGIAVGLVLAALLTPLLRDLLYQVAPRDVRAFGGAIAALLAAAWVASWLPAWRATRMMPMEALRHE